MKFAVASTFVAVASAAATWNMAIPPTPDKNGDIVIHHATRCQVCSVFCTSEDKGAALKSACEILLCGVQVRDGIYI